MEGPFPRREKEESRASHLQGDLFGGKAEVYCGLSNCAGVVEMPVLLVEYATKLVGRTAAPHIRSRFGATT